MTHENVSDVVEMAKWLKERRVEQGEVGKDGSFDIVPTVVFWRAGREIAQVFANEIRRDQGLEIVWLGVRAFAPDRVAMITDAYYATEKFIRERGRTIKGGQLQTLFERGRSDLVGEGLAVVWADRTGGCYATQVGYEIDRPAHKIIWESKDHVIAGGGELRLEGIVPDALRRSFDQGDLMTDVHSLGMRSEDFDMTDAEARLHADIATAKVLTMSGYMVAMPAYTEQDAEVISESMKQIPGLEYYLRGPGGTETSSGWPT